MNYIAYFTLTNCGGIGIRSIDNDEVAWDLVTDKILEQGVSPIEYDYDEDGEAYFKSGDRKIYLYECLRTAI